MNPGVASERAKPTGLGGFDTLKFWAGRMAFTAMVITAVAALLDWALS